jgi:hypothetical protein
LAVIVTDTNPDEVAIAPVSKDADALGVPTMAKVTSLTDVSGVGAVQDVELISTSNGFAKTLDTLAVCDELPTAQR